MGWNQLDAAGVKLEKGCEVKFFGNRSHYQNNHKIQNDVGVVVKVVQLEVSAYGGKGSVLVEYKHDHDNHLWLCHKDLLRV
jgi:hypothetical protein